MELKENKEFFINCDGMDIHAKLDFPSEQKDKMPVLVLIPGFTGHIEEEHICRIAKGANEVGFVVLRAELYGHGKSAGEFYDHNVLLWMMEAMRVVDYACNLPFAKDVYLAGHSQGGLCSVVTAGLVADKIKALLALSPAMIIYDIAVNGGNMLGADVDPNNLQPEIVTDAWKMSSNYVRAARMLPVDMAIKTFNKPVVVIHGTGDDCVPYKYGEELAGKYKNARLVPIDGDDHCFGLHMDQMVDEVKKFLMEMEEQ